MRNRQPWAMRKNEIIPTRFLIGKGHFERMSLLETPEIEHPYSNNGDAVLVVFSYPLWTSGPSKVHASQIPHCATVHQGHRTLVEVNEQRNLANTLTFVPQIGGPLPGDLCLVV